MSVTCAKKKARKTQNTKYTIRAQKYRELVASVPNIAESLVMLWLKWIQNRGIERIVEEILNIFTNPQIIPNECNTIADMEIEKRGGHFIHSVNNNNNNSENIYQQGFHMFSDEINREEVSESSKIWQQKNIVSLIESSFTNIISARYSLLKHICVGLIYSITMSKDHTINIMDEKYKNAIRDLLELCQTYHILNVLGMFVYKLNANYRNESNNDHTFKLNKDVYGICVLFVCVCVCVCVRVCPSKREQKKAICFVFHGWR